VGRAFLASALPSKRFLPRVLEAWKKAKEIYARYTGGGEGKFG
jgi:hypothetical protein